MSKKVNVFYKKKYRMRALGPDGLNTAVSIPRVVIEREAERHGLTIREFREQFRAVARFDSFDGIRYTFEPIEREELTALSSQKEILE